MSNAVEIKYYWRVELRVRGIRGRDRTSKQHILRVSDIETTESYPMLTSEQIPSNETCVEMLTAHGLKVIERAMLWFVPVRVETIGDSITTEEWSPFDYRISKTEIVLL